MTRRMLFVSALILIGLLAPSARSATSVGTPTVTIGAVKIVTCSAGTEVDCFNVPVVTTGDQEIVSQKVALTITATNGTGQTLTNQGNTTLTPPSRAAVVEIFHVFQPSNYEVVVTTTYKATAIGKATTM